MIGAKWTGGPFSIGAAFEHDWSTKTVYADGLALADNFESQNYVVNGAFRLANGEIFAGYSWTKGAMTAALAS